MSTLLKALAVALTVLTAAAASAETPSLRIAVLKFGTVNWLMQTIKSQGLDTANGYTLDVVPLAGKPATQIAFQSGDVDVIVDDWMFALNKKASGVDMRFAAYSRALGSLMSKADLTDFCDIKGRPVGVVGGRLDKSWLVFQALATQKCGLDLAEETQAVFGAPPLMSKQLEGGAVDAVSTFWHFSARLGAGGANTLMGVTEAMAELGISPAPPLIGFVWEEGKPDPKAISGFIASVRAAGEILKTDDAAWDALRPKMKAKEDATFVALRDAYRAGVITAPWTAADTAASEKLYDLLTTLGGAEFRVKAGPFTSEIFAEPAAGG